MTIKSSDQLRKLYGLPSERARKKQLDALEKHGINFIKKSPFLVLSTYDKDGAMDVSPRGGKPGFVKILDAQTIVVPDSKGNNRIDNLMNIVDTGRIGTLFLIPGINETLRLNGSAYVSTDKCFIDLFSEEKKTIKACIVISIEEVFLHCAKAFMRSELWDKDSKVDSSNFPSMGEMLKDQLGSTGKAESRQEMTKRYKKDL